MGDLDIRFKSLSPRKGKIEVEDYDRRLNELEKHEKKLEKHKENINAKNKVADEENNKILEKIDKDFNETEGIKREIIERNGRTRIG